MLICAESTVCGMVLLESTLQRSVCSSAPRPLAHRYVTGPLKAVRPLRFERSAVGECVSETRSNRLKLSLSLRSAAASAGPVHFIRFLQLQHPCCWDLVVFS